MQRALSGTGDDPRTMAELDARGSVNDRGPTDYRTVRENYSEIWLRRFSLVCFLSLPLPSFSFPRGRDAIPVIYSGNLV